MKSKRSDAGANPDDDAAKSAASADSDSAEPGKAESAEAEFDESPVVYSANKVSAARNFNPSDLPTTIERNAPQGSIVSLLLGCVTSPLLALLLLNMDLRCVRVQTSVFFVEFHCFSHNSR